MSGSPVYIDGRLVGAVSYSLGQFSKEPIAGITPIDEMVEAATLPGPRRQAARVDLPTPLTPEGLRTSLRRGVLVGAALRRQPVGRPGADGRLGGARHRRPAAADRHADHAWRASIAAVADPVIVGVPRSGLPAGARRRRRQRLRRGAVARAAAPGRPDRRRADERRPGARRHGHRDRRRRRPRLRVRPPVLQPGPHRLPDDARLRA